MPETAFWRHSARQLFLLWKCLQKTLGVAGPTASSYTQPWTKHNYYLENFKDSEAKIKIINYNNNNNYYNIFNFYSADQQKFGALCNIVENL